MPALNTYVGDVRVANVDILVLKYASKHRGADLAIAQALGGGDPFVQTGQHKFFPGRPDIEAKEVLVLGVGALSNFDYLEINAFARRALKIIRSERPQARSVGITLHGPGYGLDELASIHTLVQGLLEDVSADDSTKLTVSIIDSDGRRGARIQRYLDSLGSKPLPKIDGPDGGFDMQAATAISSNGSYSKRLFAAMPFSGTYLDHWELALQPAAHSNELVIERLDHEQFTGEVVAEIRSRIERAAAVIALLDENNPNVFLEVGYAWGVKKPAILILHESHEPPFDVKNQRLIRYGRLGELKNALTNELKGLLTKAAI